MKSATSWNLLPRNKVEARASRLRRRRWMVGGAVYLGVLLTVSAALWIFTHPGMASANTELAVLTQRNTESAAAIDAFQRQFKSVNEVLEHRQNLAEQPDFSAILRLISRSVDPETVLRQFSLHGSGSDKLKATPAAAGSEREPRHFVLVIQGTSTGESSVAHLTTRLTASGVFDRVELRRTGRDATGTGTGVVFELECVLSEPTGRGPTVSPKVEGRTP